MPDEEKRGVEAEMSQASPAETQVAQTDEPAKSDETARKRNEQEYNWAEARKKMQELERKAQEYEKRLSEIQKPPEKDDLAGLADDDIVTAAQARKLAAKMAKAAAEEAIKAREAQTVDDRLSFKYSDFSQVVTEENIKYLKENEPELALSLYHLPDPYQQGVAAYKLIKRLNLSQESPEKKKVAENLQKPVSINAVGKGTPLSNAHLFEKGLTPELKKQLWKEMQEAKKGY